MNSNHYMRSILYGVLTIFTCIMLLALFLSLILRFTSIGESSLGWLFTILSFIVVLFGGMMSGGRAKKRGFMVGAGTAIAFTMVVFMVQYLGYDHVFSMKQWMMHGGYLGAAMLGGIMGVNMSANQK